MGGRDDTVGSNDLRILSPSIVECLARQNPPGRARSGRRSVGLSIPPILTGKMGADATGTDWELVP